MSVVTTSTPGKVFEFEATAGPIKYATWGYLFEECDEGCVVTEYTKDKRGPVTKFAGKLISGVSDRERHNIPNMEQTLQRLKEVAEGTGT